MRFAASAVRAPRAAMLALGIIGANPHIWFYIDVKDDTGKVTNWGLEMGSTSQLLRAGWKRDSMKISDVVTVEGSRGRDGSPIATATAVILNSTGQRLFAASSQGQ